MNLTNIFRFRKPEGTDPVNVEDFNDNFDVIDTELNKRPEKTGNASDMVTTFSQAASRANLTPGEKISVSFGKIMKYFADMKTVAFTGSYADLSNKPSIPGGAAANQAVANNCTTTAAGSVLDARQGKVLMDKANQINSDLTNNVSALNNQLATIKVYVGSDGKLHFVNRAGADTVLPFNPTFTKISNLMGTFTSSANRNDFATGVTGKELWKTIFIVPMTIPASGSANNNFYNGNGITYDASTGVISIWASYVRLTADVYYVK